VRITAAAAPALLLLLLAACGDGQEANSSTPLAASKTRLHVITGLPLFFADGFTLEGEKNPVIARLEQDFDIVPVDGPEQLPPGGVLLAAQPRAMTAERLVAMDRWVREGGRLLLLADPWLTWGSEAPFGGDPGRPPVEYADTGLLAHWGLTLEKRRTLEAERIERRLGGDSVGISAPGSLTSSGGACVVAPDGFVARCRLGRGTAVVVADADLLNSGEDRAPLEAVAAELEALAQR
jgi:hypothetical protein